MLQLCRHYRLPFQSYMFIWKMMIGGLSLGLPSRGEGWCIMYMRILYYSIVRSTWYTLMHSMPIAHAILKYLSKYGKLSLLMTWCLDTGCSLYLQNGPKEKFDIMFQKWRYCLLSCLIVDMGWKLIWKTWKTILCGISGY